MLLSGEQEIFAFTKSKESKDEETYCMKSVKLIILQYIYICSYDYKILHFLTNL